jgi:hypothetical protein
MFFFAVDLALFDVSGFSCSIFFIGLFLAKDAAFSAASCSFSGVSVIMDDLLFFPPPLVVFLSPALG